MPPDTRDDAGAFTHAVVVLVVVLSTTVLRALHDLDTATLSTVYGAALGYASGLTMGKRIPSQ